MAYEGQIAVINLGTGGMWTDSPQTRIPAQNLVLALNCQFYYDALEKEAGSRRWNQTVYSSGVKNFKDFWPNEIIQRVIIVTKDGLTYSCPSAYVTNLVTASGVAPVNLNANGHVSLVTGGNEQQGNDKKCFIFTGADPVQVISGTNSVRTNIASPPADWSGTDQPFGGVIHRGALFAFGNMNNPDGIYRSSALDHEDFSSNLVYPVFPGESEKVICAYVFRNRLYAFKYPRGVYQLVDSDPDPTLWYFTKFTDDWGGISPFCAQTVLDDVIVKNNFGSLTSGKAALIYGDLATSDVFHQNNVYGFADLEIRKDADVDTHLLYYPSKKTLFASFQSNAGYRPDRICRLDYKAYPQSAPKISWTTKDQPNCLGLIKDNQKVERPFYGADDGFLYQMDMSDHWVGDESTNQTAYEMVAITPAFDFSQANVLLGQQNKRFDFLEVEYEPTGDWDLSVDIFIDGRFHATRQINLSGRAVLDEFNLDVDSVDNGTPFSKTVPINGLGRRIAFKMYNGGLGQSAKITNLRIFYNLSGQQATSK